MWNRLRVKREGAVWREAAVARVELATRIPKSLHRKLKLHCVTTETSVMDFVTQAIAEKLARTRAVRAKRRRVKG